MLESCCMLESTRAAKLIHFLLNKMLLDFAGKETLNFYPKSEMAVVFLLDYNKYKHTKEKNLENKLKTYSKLDNISDVLSEETKTIPETCSVLYVLLRFFPSIEVVQISFYCMLMWRPSVLCCGDITHVLQGSLKLAFDYG